MACRRDEQFPKIITLIMLIPQKGGKELTKCFGKFFTGKKERKRSKKRVKDAAEIGVNSSLQFRQHRICRESIRP